MTDPRLDLTIADGIARLTIRRAEKLNALDAAMVDALLPVCRQIERSDAFVVILGGEGGKSFCAGGDIGLVAVQPARVRAPLGPRWPCRPGRTGASGAARYRSSGWALSGWRVGTRRLR